MATQKPDLTRVWANGAPPANVVDPDTTTPGKVSAGWQAEVPPFEHFNFLQKWFTQGLAHFNEQGIGVWDTDTTYPINGLAKGSDGEIYRAISEQSGNDPVTDGEVNWVPQISRKTGVVKYLTAESMRSGKLESGMMVMTLGRKSILDEGAAIYAIRTSAEYPGADNRLDIILDNGNIAVFQVQNNEVNSRQFGITGISDGSESLDLNLFIQYLSSSRNIGVLVGDVYFSSDMVVEPNVTLKAGGSNFGGGLIPMGAAGIRFDPTINVAGQLFHNNWKDITIYGDRSTKAEVLFIKDSYSCYFDNVRIHDLDGADNPNKVGVSIQGDADIVFEKLTILGGATTPLQGVKVETGIGDDAESVTFISPDIEKCATTMDIVSGNVSISHPYFERYTSVGIEKRANGSLTMTGGQLKNSGGSALGMRVTGDNCNVYGTDFPDPLNTGTKPINVFAGWHKNVNFHGVPRDLISYDAGGSGMTGPCLSTSEELVSGEPRANIKILDDNVPATFWTLDVNNASSQVPIICRLKVWATTGYGKDLQILDFIVSRNGGGGQVVAAPPAISQSQENASGNFAFTMTVSLNAGADVNELDMDVNVDLTGAIVAGTTIEVLTTLEVLSHNTDLRVIKK